MNAKMRAGKASELRVASELIAHGIDVYIPSVDDQAIDMILRVPRDSEVRFYDVQVKSVEGHNRIVGITAPREEGNYLLIIHCRHKKSDDELFYLTREQVRRHHLNESNWNDLNLHADDRNRYLEEQTLAGLAEALKAGEL